MRTGRNHVDGPPDEPFSQGRDEQQEAGGVRHEARQKQKESCHDEERTIQHFKGRNLASVGHLADPQQQAEALASDQPGPDHGSEDGEGNGGKRPDLGADPDQDVQLEQRQADKQKQNRHDDGPRSRSVGRLPPI